MAEKTVKVRLVKGLRGCQQRHRLSVKALGLNKVVTTNKQGVARLGLTPSKAGIMLVKITSVKACNTARIGVVGVFEPPVTG